MVERRLFGRANGSDSTLYARDAEVAIPQQPPRPQPVGFWHHDLHKVRKHAAIKYPLTVLMLFVFVMAVLLLYWAVLFRVEDKMSALTVHVVDFDGQAPYGDVEPLVGPLVTELALQTNALDRPTLGFSVLPAADFGNDPMAVRQSVYDEHCYAAVVVNANASSLLMAAVLSGNASYDPSGAVQFILLSARDETAYSSYIYPQLQAFSDALMARFGTAWAQTLAGSDAVTKEMLGRAPSAVNPGIAPLKIDLRPFLPPTATPSVTIGLIYLIIMAFFSFAFFFPIHQQFVIPAGHRPLHFWQFIIWRWLATSVSYVFISLAYSLVSLSYQIPFWKPPASATEAAFSASAYGRGSFPVYWAINFVGMMALGLASENVTMIIGQPWTALWLIFWVITNVATAFYTLDLAPDFFRWGYAWPLYNIVQASRTVLFDLHSRIGLNFGVLFIWVAVNSALYPFCCYFMRGRVEREKKAAEKSKGKFAVDPPTPERVNTQDTGASPSSIMSFWKGR
ncbi:MNNG and nitrosoguanidine resistance protein [Pestalotiopsis sp. NC0098]|nr:MNNG and nitrosoguanidine resistance protein [Pestalotiopsis sp. NC0098]